MFKIICTKNNTSICVENFIPKRKINQALEYWKEFGMEGVYKAILHSPEEIIKMS